MKKSTARKLILILVVCFGFLFYRGFNSSRSSGHNNFQQSLISFLLGNTAVACDDPPDDDPPPPPPPPPDPPPDPDPPPPPPDPDPPPPPPDEDPPPDPEPPPPPPDPEPPPPPDEDPPPPIDPPPPDDNEPPPPPPPDDDPPDEDPPPPPPPGDDPPGDDPPPPPPPPGLPPLPPGNMCFDPSGEISGWITIPTPGLPPCYPFACDGMDGPGIIDDCGNTIQVACSQEDGTIGVIGCAYRVFYNGTLVSSCIWDTTANNAWFYRKTRTGVMGYTEIMHINQDMDCDEGCSNESCAMIIILDCMTGTRDLYWRKVGCYYNAIPYETIMDVNDHTIPPTYKICPGHPEELNN